MLGLTGVPARAQSLVEVARLARAMRERHGPPAKVYTDDDLPDPSGSGTAPRLTVASAVLFQSMREAARERERQRALRALLPSRPASRPRVSRVDATPTEAPCHAPATDDDIATTGGIPLALAYAGYPVVLGSRHGRRPHQHTAGADAGDRGRRRFAGANRRTRLDLKRSRPDSGQQIEPPRMRPRRATDTSRRAGPSTTSRPRAGRPGTGRPARQPPPDRARNGPSASAPGAVRARRALPPS